MPQHLSKMQRTCLLARHWFLSSFGLVALYACANLRIDSMTHSPSSPTTVDSITFRVVVKNTGWRNAPPSQLLFKVGGESHPPSFALPALTGGTSVSVSRTVLLAIAQNYQNTAIADATNVVREWTEADNSAMELYTVRPFNLDEWLVAHPAVGSAIAWEQAAAAPNQMVREEASVMLFTLDSVEARP
jgi:hypothetical protein